MKTFALDIYEAKKLGIRKWQRDFFWPISDEEFFKIGDAIADVFLKELESGNPTSGDILISNAVLVGRFASFLHVLLVLDRLASQGYAIRSGDRSEFFWDAMYQRSTPTSDVLLAKRGILERQTPRIKALAKFFLLNRFTPRRIYRQLKVRKYVVSLGTFSMLKKKYCENEEIVFHRSVNDYLPENGERVEGISPFPEGCIHGLVNGLARVAEGFNLELSDLSKSYLENLTRNRLCSSLVLYEHILQGTQRRIHRVLLSEVGKAANKTFCLAVKRRFGSEIVGFEHGNTFGALLSKYFSVRELAHCDKYVVSSSGSIPNFKANQQVSKFPCGSKTEIVSVESDYYLSLWKKNRKTPPPRKIRSVMLIGFPMTPFRYLELPGHFSLFHLDLELRLISFLKERGLHVIYKAHPEQAAAVEGIFEDLADEVCFAPFEDVSDKGDATLFVHTDTSTFGIALCGVKPIIVIEVDGKTWNQEAFCLISKRCRMVPGRMDERNRIVFDEVRLEESLAEEITAPNTEFLERFMFSRGGGEG